MPPRSWPSSRQASESARGELVALAPARTPEPRANDVMAPLHAAGGRNDEGTLLHLSQHLDLSRDLQGVGSSHRPEDAAASTSDFEMDGYVIVPWPQDDDGDARMSRSAPDLGPLLPGRSDDHLRLSGARSNLADISLISRHHRHARLDQSTLAAECSRRACEVCRQPDDLDSLEAALGQTTAYKEEGRYGDAEHVCKWVIRGRETRLGSEHPLTLDAKHMLSSIYALHGRPGDSEDILKKIIGVKERAVGPSHPDTLVKRCNLASAYWHQGRLDEAVALYKNISRGFESFYGDDHRLTLAMMLNLGRIYREQGNHGDAEPLVSRVLDGYRKRPWPKEMGGIHTAFFEMGLLYLDMQRIDDAEAVLREELQLCEQLSLASDFDITTPCDLFTILNRIGCVCLKDGMYDRAKDFLKRALSDCQARYGPDALPTLEIASNLVEVYLLRDKYSKALRGNQRVRDGLGKNPQATPDLILAAHHQLGVIHEGLGEYDKARETYEKVAKEYQNTQGPGFVEKRMPALTNMEALAGLLDDMGHKKEALFYYEQVLEGHMGLHGRDDEECRELEMHMRHLREL